MARVDHFHDPNAPQPNSIAVAVSAFVLDADGRLLMIRRTDNDLYSIPGGQLELGETLTQTAVREFIEETGIEIEVTGLIGIYSNPDHVIAYDDGEVRQEFSICFRGRPIGGELRTSSESKEAAWIEQPLLAELTIHPSTRLRIQHGFDNRSEPYYT
ncbi:NUDIX hydrolase [Kibdelosporangium phytohabitans]|uniref:NUDIX hydrolase n=1 Tax=Kibdelosporangium phytohabitans TaxID=860235 RepID=A0A0N9I135_9PSEU|nr:NUDIX domain-containing protein [Kibdelosporangium phytohabitans]ALG13560.1 NUDIX hydrolase [Kibdelosporangium phytohabitans]MBE1465425.1 ADP-ribose pyrophosphatase YjhB (NUDIX family) [Kibdelosporangium phytohabitans]